MKNGVNDVPIFTRVLRVHMDRDTEVFIRMLLRVYYDIVARYCLLRYFVFAKVSRYRERESFASTCVEIMWFA